MDERQSLETLQRDEKAASRILSTLKEKQEGLEDKRETRSNDLRIQTEKKAEVSFLLYAICPF